MHFDEATLNRLSNLARIDLTCLTADETHQLRDQIGHLLSWVEATHALDVRDVEPLVHPADLQTWMRADEPLPPPGTQAILANAPAHDQDSFLVPQVVDDSPKAR